MSDNKSGLLMALGLGAVFGISYFQKKNKPVKKEVSNFDQLVNIFPRLVAEFVSHMGEEYELSQAMLDRIDGMIKYTCTGGKMWRGQMVLDTVKQLCEHKGLEFEPRAEPALILGWCIEILQAHFLVADDMMDASETRRGKPCWYKLPEIQLDAINDAIILESFLYFLLKQYFSHDTQMYISVVDLYHEVSLCTQMGQMLDLTSQPQGQKNPTILKKFNQEMYDQIVKYKTAIYTFYLSTAAAMILCNYTDKKDFAVAREICIGLGNKFQIEDDYLDCYGDPEVIGKIGTDIKDHKCSWLVVQALKLMNARQRQVLEAHYGKESKEDELEIKKLYNELKIDEVYDQQEDASYARISALITANQKQLPASIFMPYLNKIHKRQK